MKLSKAIEKLTQLLEQHGDLELLDGDPEGNNSPVNDYEFCEGPESRYFENNRLVRSEFPYGEFVIMPI